MPSTYPTDIDLTPRSITFVPKTQATSFTSPFGGQTQVVRYSGQYWQLDLQYPPLFQTSAEKLMAFFVGLNGMDGTFYYKLPSKFLMTGTLTPTITGNGNTFTGATGQTGKFGVSSGYRLVQFTDTGSLFPRLPTGSTSVGTSNGALFRLASNELNITVDHLMLYGMSVGIVEAI